MRRLMLIFFLVFVFIIGGGLIFLITWDIPAPSHIVEKKLDDSRFPR
tara:strand:+ start:324 stop:464 length:141 start_codon:yes stop_codon:yes gene_type:complete